MQSKFLILLLLSTPLLAQDVDTPVTPTTPESAPQTITQAEPTKNTDPTCISVSFKLIKQDATVEKETWKKFKKLLTDCHAAAKEKKFEQATTLFDQLASTKPEGIAGTITVNANQQTTRAAEQAGVVASTEKKVKGSFTKVMCEIYKTDVNEETWNELSTLAFEVIKPQQEVTYEKARQVAFAIIAKS